VRTQAGHSHSKAPARLGETNEIYFGFRRYRWRCACTFRLGRPVGAATTDPGQSFAAACAGNQAFSGAQFPGVSFNNGQSANGAICNNFTTTSGGLTSWISAAASGTQFGLNYSNNAGALAGQGVIKLDAHNNAPDQVQFPGAVANAGWNDTLTLCTQTSGPCNQAGGPGP